MRQESFGEDARGGRHDAWHTGRTARATPGYRPDTHICVHDIARLRRIHPEQMLERERGALTALDRKVLESLETGTPLSAEPEIERDDKRRWAKGPPTQWRGLAAPGYSSSGFSSS